MLILMKTELKVKNIGMCEICSQVVQNNFSRDNFITLLV